MILDEPRCCDDSSLQGDGGGCALHDKVVMIRRDKLIAKLRRMPRDFAWNEWLTLLQGLGYSGEARQDRLVA